MTSHGQRWIVGVAAMVAATGVQAVAGTLEVGEGKAFSRIEEAVAKAVPGDVVVVWPKKEGGYGKVALLVRKPRITIRGADPKAYVKLDGNGFDYSGRGSVPRAIVQFDPGADGCVLEGFELSGAKNESANGAGVRINQANDVVIRRCKIHGNEMGIMSNGDVAAKTGTSQLIEGCLITDNGTQKQAGYNHNLYLGGTSVTVRGCEIARAVTGHNLKSRAHFNWIEYNYIHDSANRELDLVDAKGNTDAEGSHSVLLGNYIVKAPKMNGNKTAIHFGQDGKNDHRGTLYLVHNTIVTGYVSPVVDLSAPGANAVFYNNLVSDRGARHAGVLVHARDGAMLDKVAGEGNELPEGFRAKAGGVQTGAVVSWDKVKLPSPGKSGVLMEYLGLGKVEPRKAVSAGAGAMKP